ncbi:Pro-Pol polyprotein, partial [Mucuna pruriens]
MVCKYLQLCGSISYYIWNDPYLWRVYNDEIIRKCILDAEIKSVLQFCHVAPGGSHYGSTWTARKALDCGFYWSTIFRDAYQFGIDFMGPFLVSNDYVSQWVESITTKTNDAKVLVDFLKSNIFCRFGVPKALISDQGSHFCNRVMSSLLHKYGVVHRIATAYHP